MLIRHAKSDGKLWSVGGNEHGGLNIKYQRYALKINKQILRFVIEY
jgi:hypothetical protein